MPTAIVTGGSRGIGAATATLLASQGFDVCFSFHSNETAAAQVVAEIESAGQRAVAVRCDVANEADVLALFETCDDRLGSLSLLVNNAGILETQMRADLFSFARLQRVMSVNVVGAFLCAREAIRRMSTEHGGGGGSIVNVSSGAARLGSPNEYVDYAASKGAIDTMTIGLSKELGGEGIRVNAVRPGLIHTDIHATGGEPGRVDRLASRIPLGRGGTAQEVAQAICWLASDEASFVTGTFVDVTGGL